MEASHDPSDDTSGAPRAATAVPSDLELARAVARYHAGCLRVIGAQNVALRDVRTTKKAALCVDVGSLSSAGSLLSRGFLEIVAPTSPPPDAAPPVREDYDRRWVIWERLNDLTAKAAVENHAKEVVYGGPLLQGFLPKPRTARFEPILAPLFMVGVTLRVTERGTVEIRATDEPPRFNTVVWREAVSGDALARIVDQGIEAQVSLAGGWDPERVQTLLSAIATVMPSLRPAVPSEDLAEWPGLSESRVRPHGPELTLFDGATLFLANRASPYLLADLERIASRPDAYVHGGRPLSVLLNPPSSESRPELRAPNIDEVVYPFPSNAAQRQVADAIGKNQIVVVQGPPGNGKSLTIANLVAHLAANGKRVLVSSHKTQALTVVRDKLEDTGQRFLFASLIGDGAAAKRELQKQIADVRAFAAQANRTTLTRQLKDIEQRRAANGRAFADLRADFIQRAQPDQTEAAEAHEYYRGVAVLPAEDPSISSGSRPAAATALRRLDELAREHASVWGTMRASAAAACVELTPERETLMTFLDHQRARIAAASDPAVQGLLAEWQPLIDADPARLDSAQQELVTMRKALLAVLDGPQEIDAGQELADAPQLLTDVERGIRDLETAFAEARARAKDRDLVAAGPELRQQVLQQHELLGQLFRRAKARSWLEANARGAAGLSRTRVAEWVSFWDWWSTVRTQANGLAGGLATDVPQRFAPDAVQIVLARGARATSRARAVLAARQAARSSVVPLPLDAALAARDRASLDVALHAAELALRAARADRDGNALKGTAQLTFLGGRAEILDGLLDTGQWEAAQQTLAALDAVAAALPALEERRRLLDGPLAQLSHATELTESTGEQLADQPAFLGEPERALDVHAAYLRFRDIASGQTTADRAAQLTDAAEQVLDDAGRLLGLRIQQRILDGFTQPSFLASLEKFRRAISASPKRFERFEELKNSPDFNVDVLTRVFPCWIMRPEDACRVFPLRPDVFDVLIVDEASQCNPDQVLPLFARAGSVAVVGDAKQLSNEDLRRTLSGDANRALIHQAGLDKLDPYRLFDQTRNSLLELVSQRQQADVVLNEHFRCRPELIAFSNERFYGSTLTIVRDRRDDRGLRPPLLIREVQLDEPFSTARGAKVNQPEAEALVDDLIRRLNDERYNGMTFGVLSLFREQVEYIQAQIERRVSPTTREQRRLICSTVDGFQGDERDVILYSWRYTAGDHGSVFAFTNGGPGEQRINVALTRAKHQAIHFVSTPVEKFPLSASNVTGYLRHALEPAVLLEHVERRTHREPSGRARDQVKQDALARGLEVVEDYVACGVSVDLLITTADGSRRAAVFVDAERDEHPPVNVPERVDQHELLRRAGWQIVRLPATVVLDEPHASAAAIETALTAAGRMAVGEQTEEPVTQITIHGHPDNDAGLRDLEIAHEDCPDYHWDVPSVEARLHAGEAVFMSGFEEELYSSLAAVDDLKIVPQWPSRGKCIDLVITDRTGRRLAIEADGSQHHETPAGKLIPEDLDRQALLEEAGWTFCRVAQRDYVRDPASALRSVLEALDAQPPDDALAERIWGPAITDIASAATLPLLGETAPAPDASVAEWSRARALATTPIPDTIGAVEAEDGATRLTPTPLNDNTTLPPSPEHRLQSAADESDDFEPLSLTDVQAPLDLAGTVSQEQVPVAMVPGSVIGFEDAQLGTVAMRIAELVRARGGVPVKDLCDTLEHSGVFATPRTHHRSVNRFAWSANGKGWLDLVDQVWVPAAGKPMLDPHYGSWTYTAIVGRARQLLKHDPDPFEPLLAEVYSGPRVPKLAMTLVGSAINRAKRFPEPASDTSD